MGTLWARRHLCLYPLCLLFTLLFAGEARAQTSGGAYGYVWTYREDTYQNLGGHGPGASGRAVDYFYCTQRVFSFCVAYTKTTVVTNADGYFQTPWVTGVGSSGYLRTDGSEVSIPAVGFGNWRYAEIHRAPHMISPNGGMWLRKYGTGEYPLFVFEGFDSEDGIKTGAEVPSPTPGQPGLIGLFDMIPLNPSTTAYGTLAPTLPQRNDDGTPVTNPPVPVYTSFLEYLRTNNYSIYFITSGSKWGSSIQGTGDHSNGQAYQAMKLAWQARQRYAPHRKMILGGFSLGGALTQAGLGRWCNGDFYWQIGPEYDLRPGCNEVAMWWAADAALGGATVPESLMRFIKDSRLDNPKALSFRTSINSTPARELFNRWVTDGCNTHCFNGDGDPQNCDSQNDSFFLDGCQVDDSVHTSFVEWARTGPTRSTTGQVVPAVAFSMGMQPQTWGGIKQDCANTNNEFMRVHIDTQVSYGWGLCGEWCTSHDTTDMILRGRTIDCSHGSRLTPLRVLNNTPVTDGLEGLGTLIATGGFINGTADGKILVPFLPSYISTSSSLLWPEYNAYPWIGWKDWRTADRDLNHDPTLIPATHAGMTMAWISEFAKGNRYMPVATGSKTPSVSRWATAEWFNGQDDDGDEMVDELRPWEGWNMEAGGPSAAWLDPSNQILTLVAKNRYWNVRLSDSRTIDSGYLNTGWKFQGAIKMTPQPWPEQVPKISGLFPWDAEGITGAYPSYDNTKLVLISGTRIWAYNWASSTMQWARAFGPSEQGWAGIIPNFSTAPAVNGEYPWSSVGITGAYHEPGARYLTLYRGTMFWRWDFWTNSWSASGQNGQINGTGAHYYEPGSYYHNHYIVHPWGLYDIYRSDDVLLTPNLHMQNLPLWQNAPQVMPGIVVESATYGGNCGAPANNQLGNLWANCAGKQTCLYRIEAAWIGDPAVGCAKTYEATYYCPGTDQRRSVWVPGEAGFGSVAALSCPYDP